MKTVQLTEDQAAAYANMSGFDNDGNVTLQQTEDDEWSFIESLYLYR